MSKSSKMLFFAFAILLSSVAIRGLIYGSDETNTFVIEKIVEAETEPPIAATTKATKTTTAKNTTEKSTNSTKMTSEIVENSEISTEISELYININTATHEEFVMLNGIGDYIAENIIAYRNENGDFRNTEELMNVSGIGEKIFASICGYVYVENPVYYEETVPDEPEIVEEHIEETTENPDIFPININEADAETLMLLPYVNEEIAGRIIELRESIGRINNEYELLYVDGLQNGQVAELIEYICLE